MPSFNKQRNTWQAKVVYKGKSYTATCATKREARAWETKKRKELETASKQTRTISLGELAQAHLDFAQQRYVYGTYAGRRKAFKRIFEQIPPSTPLDQISKLAVLKIHQELAQTRKGSTVNKMRRDLVAAWNWGREYLQGVPAENPFQVEKQAEEEPNKYVPAVEEIEALVRAARNKQDEVMLMCYLNTGARLREIINLRWGDVDLDNYKIRLWTKKRKGGGRESNWLPLTEQLHDYLEEWKEEGRSEEWVFTRANSGKPYTRRNGWFDSLCKRAGVKKFTCHNVRHFTAAFLHNNGETLKAIQGVLRHKSVQTTDKYLQSITAQDATKLTLIACSVNGKHQPKKKSEVQLKVVGE